MIKSIRKRVNVAIPYLAAAILVAGFAIDSQAAVVKQATGLKSLCTMISDVMGNGVGNAIATIGVMTVGVGATLGRVSWQLAVTVAVGIAGMTSAPYIIGKITGNFLGGCWGN